MKTWRKVQKMTVAVGIAYGMWLGGHVDATGTDSRSAFVMILVTAVLAISLCIPDKEQEKNL